MEEFFFLCSRVDKTSVRLTKTYDKPTKSLYLHQLLLLHIYNIQTQFKEKKLYLMKNKKLRTLNYQSYAYTMHTFW